MSSPTCNTEVKVYSPEDYAKSAFSGEEACSNLVIPAEPTASCRLGIGLEVVVSRPPQAAKPRSISLPFGLSMPVERKAGRKRKRQPGPSSAAASSGAAEVDIDIVDGSRDENEVESDAEERDGQPSGREEQDGLPAPAELEPSHDDDLVFFGFIDDIALPGTCQRNLAEAITVSEQAFADAASLGEDHRDERNRPQPSPSQPSQPSRLPASNDGDGRSTAPSVSGLVFNKKLGIIGVKEVTRRGLKCMHCHCELDKGEFRFSYAWHHKKPEKSLHVSCATSIPKQLIPESAAALKGFIHSADLVPAARQACQEGLAILEPGRGG